MIDRLCWFNVIFFFGTRESSDRLIREESRIRCTLFFFFLIDFILPFTLIQSGWIPIFESILSLWKYNGWVLKRESELILTSSIEDDRVDLRVVEPTRADKYNPIILCIDKTLYAAKNKDDRSKNRRNGVRASLIKDRLFPWFITGALNFSLL